MNGERRRFTGVWVVAVLVALVVTAAFLQLRERVVARAAFPLVEGRVVVEGLGAPVSIHRDEYGIPHVAAANATDAFFGLGFVHAQDRLDQMLWLRRVARGRSAEVLGPEGLPADRRARLLDLGGLADAELERLDAATRERVEAYASGVNARIRRVRAGASRPPVALAEPVDAIEEWQAADSLVVLKLYAWGLADSIEATLVLNDINSRLRMYGARKFFPDQTDPTADGRIAAAATGAEGDDPLRAAARMRGRSIGSSAWVLGGAHTASGAPMLVADAHLEATAPALLYIAHFRGGGFDAAGATIPGVPVVWTGRNRKVAWASTNPRAVTIDLYQESISDDPSPRYFDGRRWEALGQRTETLRVRGEDDEQWVVYSTRHGPLLGGLHGTEASAFALAWAGARPGARSGIASLLEIAGAASATELRQALNRHEEPPLAVVYAGSDGSAGMRVAGWIPRRTMPTDLLPLEGRARYLDWAGPVDSGSLPRQRLSRGDGWAIAADARPAPRFGSGSIEWLWQPAVRSQRIDTLLSAAVASGPVELRVLARMQADVALERARSLIATALTLAESDEPLGPEDREIAEFLRAWDGWAGPTSTGAAVYHLFVARLTAQLFEEVLGEDLFRRYLAVPQADPDEIVFRIVREAASSGADNGPWSREMVRKAIRTSLREAWFSLSYRLGANRSRWLWGRMHPLRFGPFRPGSGGFGWGADLGPFPMGGSGASVNTAEYAPGGEDFDVRVASTFRMAVDASALDQALVTLAPGQSGHPGHPHFADAVGRWREGRPYLLATAPLVVEESSRALLLLEPAP